MNVTLNQLRAFERVMRLGGFAKAAAALHLTQPSISQRIRELEAALGAALFERAGPRTRPTADAQALLPYADRMIAMLGEIRGRFGGGDPLHGTLRLGMSENVALVCLAQLLGRLQERYPAVTVLVYVGDSGNLSERLDSRELDLAVVAEPAVQRHVLQVPAGVSRLGWFAHPACGLPARAVTPAVLAQHHLMIGPPSARLHTTVMRWFQQAGVDPLRTSTCNNAAVTRAAILGGAAIGLLPVRIMRQDLEAGTVRQIAVRPALPVHRMSICWQDGGAAPTLRDCAALLYDTFRRYEVFDELLEAVPL